MKLIFIARFMINLITPINFISNTQTTKPKAKIDI